MLYELEKRKIKENLSYMNHAIMNIDAEYRKGELTEIEVLKSIIGIESDILNIKKEITSGMDFLIQGAIEEGKKLRDKENE